MARASKMFDKMAARQWAALIVLAAGLAPAATAQAAFGLSGFAARPLSQRPGGIGRFCAHFQGHARQHR